MPMDAESLMLLARRSASSGSTSVLRFDEIEVRLSIEFEKAKRRPGRLRDHLPSCA